MKHYKIYKANCASASLSEEPKSGGIYSKRIFIEVSNQNTFNPTGLNYFSRS